MRKIFIGTLIVISVISVIAAGYVISEQAMPNASLFYKEIELLSDTISIINSNYVEVVKPQKLIYGALKGMLSSLDGYSQFLDPDSFKEMKIEAEGKFGGLGIEISIKNDLLTVVSPIDGTPAHRAGLLPGDVIVKIDGEVTQDLGLQEAVKKLRGKAGPAVTLSIWREKEERVFDVTMTREVIVIKSIKESKVIEDNIGYIKLVEFQGKTGKELEEALEALNKQKIKGLILDLRNNPGGILDAAVDVSELFLKKGTLIVSTKGRIQSQNNKYLAMKSEPFDKLDLVLLVNEGSASASEIVAGAIKDNSRGVLVGQKTFGKGSVQTVVPLKDGSALKLTTAEYFTPKGISIMKMGVEPDVICEAAPEKKDKEKEPEPAADDLQLKKAIEVIKNINDYPRH